MMVFNFCESFAVDGVLCSLSTSHQYSHVLHCVYIHNNCLKLVYLMSELLFLCLPFADLYTVTWAISLGFHSYMIYFIIIVAQHYITFYSDIR